jgi:tetratricopeptide (TPR) repeat protein
MKIIVPIDDLAIELFPGISKYSNNIETNLEEVKNLIADYYSFGAFKPKVSIEDRIIMIDIDTLEIEKHDSDFRRAVHYAEQSRFNEAKQILKRLIGESPTNSEFHRVMGQIYEVEGNSENAKNHLIDSIRWDPRNKSALIMMGNLLARHENDIESAMKYYNSALAVDPNDHIALNNIGANLAHLKKFDDAERYLELAYSINSKYANTVYGLGVIKLERREYFKAFEHAIEAVKLSKENDPIYANGYALALEAAQNYVKAVDKEFIYEDYLKLLEQRSGKEIRIMEDSSIASEAKVEVAEYRGADKHLLKYNKDTDTLAHLIMHELVHLEFIFDARDIAKNKVFISNEQHKEAFIKKFEGTVKKLRKAGTSEQQIEKYLTSIYEGINTQMYNAPIDLFIENKLYNDFPQLRPIQFLSLNGMVKVYIAISNDEKIKDISPRSIWQANTILNLILSYQFEDLFGIRTSSMFNATEYENQSRNLYNQFKRKSNTRSPGEEYEFVSKWSKELGLSTCFELIDENSYLSTIDSIIGNVSEVDELLSRLESVDRDEETRKFVENQKKSGLNMAVVMFMVEALKYFEGMSQEDIKLTAFDIALLGSNGIHPDKEGYAVA